MDIQAVSREAKFWINYDISLAEEFREIAADFVLGSGAEAVVETRDGIQFSIEETASSDAHTLDLIRFFQDLDPDFILQQARIPEENWNAGWQAYFRPTPVGQRILVLPEWADANDDGRIPVRIHPGMAFGTGTHETTQLCLEFMEESISAQDRVLDLGTGSGILAIAALKLGASSVIGIDHDEQVLENLQKNLELNGIRSGFDAVITKNPPDLEELDYLVVNIIKRHLLPLLPQYFDSVKKGGTVVIGGLLKEEDPELRELLTNSPWSIMESRTKHEWIAYRCHVNI